MVAFLGFLDLMQVVREVGIIGPGGAVDALQFRTFRIAAPIGAGEAGELERLADLAGRGHVRAAAEVEPLPLLVDLEVLALGDRIHQLDLEQLALFLEEVLGLLAAPELLGEGGVAIDDLAHLGFDPGHVVGVERFLLVEVVEEPVLDHRADGHLRAGPQRLHGFRHDVRGIVTDQLQRLRIGAGDELDRDILVDGVGEVRKPAVHHHRHGPLGQRLGDALGQRLAGDPTGVGPLGTIGKCQGDVAHFAPPLTRCQPSR